MTRFLTAFVLILAAAATAQQPGPPTAESRLRDALKKLSVRVSEAETGRATAQAAQAEAEAKVADLTDKLDKMTKSLASMTKQAAADKADSEKAIDGLETRVQIKDKEIGQYKEALAKWKDGFNQAREVAEGKENERKVAVDKAVIAERKAAEYERKNHEMYKAGSEILERYASFGLGTALMSREPFVGTMRVKFQNWMQDFGDKLDSARVKPEGGVAKKETVAAQAPQPHTGKGDKPKP